MSTCPYCKFEVDENAFACSSCGRAIASSHIISQSSENIKISSKPDQPDYKRNKLSLWSLILGGVSFPSSLLFLSLMIDANISGSASDFQGVLCIPLFSLAMAPVGFVSVIFGILGLAIFIIFFLLLDSLYGSPGPEGGTIISQAGYIFILTIGGILFIIIGILAFLFILFVFLVGVIPFFLLYGVSDFLKILLHRVFKYRYDVVLKNLHSSFNELS